MYVRLPLVPESMDPWIANALSGLLYFCVSRVQTLLSSVLVRFQMGMQPLCRVFLHYAETRNEGWPRGAIISLHFTRHVVCVPSCENGGQCVAPGRCDCGSQYNGPSCQNRDSSGGSIGEVH